MAFTFDATEGGASANSNCSVEYADDYHGGNLNREVWTDATIAQKQAALAMATRTLDAELDLPGWKTTTTQARRWPRMGVYNRDGEHIDSATVPGVWKDATAELAFWFLVSDRIADNDTSLIQRMKLGALEMEFVRGLKTQVIPDVVLTMLSDFGVIAKSENGTIKLTR